MSARRLNTRAMHVCRAPGRLDLIGGNGDYVGGMVFEATIREATWAVIRLREDDRIVLRNPQMAAMGWLDHVEYRLGELTDEAAVRKLVNRDPRARWTAYVLGVFYFLLSRYPNRVRQGCDVYIQSDVPLNKGVSSSAAVEVAVMKSAASAYGEPMEGIALAENCQWVENVIAESACGVMDQMTSVLGDEGCVLPLLCQPAQPLPLVKLPEDLTCWAIDSGVSHQVTGIEYESARAAAFMGYKMICDREGIAVRRDTSGQIARFTDDRWNGYLANLSPSMFRSRFESWLPEQMTGAQYMAEGQIHVDPFTQMRPEVIYRVRACTRYSVEENLRVRTFAELARGGTGYEEMGELLYQAHGAYTECGLGCRETDQIVELVRERGSANGLFGAKITGGGAGGAVAVLGLKTARSSFDKVVEQYAEIRGGEMPYVFEGSSMGADRFGVLVVNS